jgi:microcystin-dependent protein
MNIKELLLLILTLLVLLNFYLIYKTRKVEGFETTFINEGINDYFKTDMMAIKNLYNEMKIINTIDDNYIPLPDEIKLNNVTVEGDVEIDGDLTLDDDIIFTNKNNIVLALLPQYSIIAWGTDKIAIPLGWAPCDGKKYSLSLGIYNEDNTLTGVQTPDLKGKFILTVGKGKVNGINLTPRKYAEQGGIENVFLTNEQLPKHNHKFAMNTTSDLNYSIRASNKDTREFTCSESKEGKSSVNIDEEENIKINNYEYEAAKLLERRKLNPESHNNMPPYYVLIYIMKI